MCTTAVACAEDAGLSATPSGSQRKRQTQGPPLPGPLALVGNVGELHASQGLSTKDTYSI